MATTKKTDSKMNIFQKLLEIQKQVNGLGKDKSSFNYKYVTGSKVLEHIKPIMNEYGLILKQEVLSIDNDKIDYTNSKGASKTEVLSKVMMKFTWIDSETGERDENMFGANGFNEFEKGLGSALTYAERYFLLKYFHISTDEDDIDNPNRKPEVVSKPTANVSRSTKATISDLSKVKEMLSKDKESTVKILEEKYELTPAQRKELGL
jgi:hypothetical protein